jgi:rhodanese-related sulfurtransferase
MSHPIEIDVETLRDKFAAGDDVLLIDCRERDEYDLVRLDPAVLMPMSELVGRVDELRPQQQRDVIVHCHHGGRSLRVAMWLRQQGFERVSSSRAGSTPGPRESTRLFRGIDC